MKNIIYRLYLYYIRKRICYISKIQDIINILNNISFFYKNIDGNNLINVITDCLNLYPLTELEMQKLSIIQQYYEYSNGIENFSSFLLWISHIQSVIENFNNTNNNKLLLK